MMELKVAMIVLKMEETRFVRDSTREGMVALVFAVDSNWTGLDRVVLFVLFYNWITTELSCRQIKYIMN